jgi:hypothetical protein
MTWPFFDHGRARDPPVVPLSPRGTLFFGGIASATRQSLFLLRSSDDILTGDDVEAYNADLLVKLQEARDAEAVERAEAAARAGAEALERQQAAAAAQRQAAAGFAAGNRTPVGAAAFIEQASANAGSEAEFLEAMAAAGLVENQVTE